jgi:hypothetical protein
VPDLTAALLEATGSQRAELLQQADPTELSQAITSLGHRRDPAAAASLRLIDAVVDDRGLRKAARRELHRLESAGIHPPDLDEPGPAEAAPATVRGPKVRLREAWATDIDASGARALWLLGEPPLGGAWLAAMVLNDLAGLAELSLVDTTRKRYARELEQQRRDPRTTWVDLPPDYALALVREAVDIVRSRDGSLPTRYHSYQELFGEAEHPPERALVYETISPIEVSLNPDWLADSARLIREREVAGWELAPLAGLRDRALEVARAPTAALVIPGNPPEQQAIHLLANATREQLTTERRRALRRRLEETAYIFGRTERLQQARWAVAAARALDDPSLAPEQHPFLRVLLAFGLARSIQTETVAGRRASEVLMELVERAFEHEPGRGAETTSTGLILPR